MLKKYLRNLVIVLAVLLITFTSTCVYALDAENEDNQSTDETVAVNNEENVAIEQPSTYSTETLKEHDQFLKGDTINIDYMVDGNLFIIANEVNINSEIGGDTFIMANKINIGDRCYIYSNLFAVAKDIDVSGVVYNLYAVSKNIKVSGYVYRDAKLATTDSISILGTIERNAYIFGTSNIKFEDSSNESDEKGVISRDLNYSSYEETSIP